MAASLSNGKAVFQPPYKRTSSSVPRQQENTKKTDEKNEERETGGGQQNNTTKVHCQSWHRWSSRSMDEISRLDS